MNQTDNLIVGSGLTGLLLAHGFHSAGQTVQLVEARETLGGGFRRLSQTEPFSSPGLDFFPASPEVREWLQWLQAAIPIPLRWEVQEHRPQIFDEGHWHHFSGFGDSPFASAGELSYLADSHELVVTPSLDHVVRALVEQLAISALTRSEVTGLQVVDGKVMAAVINGDKVLAAERIFFTPYPGLLNNLINGDGLTPKSRTRLAKMPTWMAVILELHHQAPLTEDSAIRIFNHGAKEFEPVVGRSWGAKSKWMTLVPSERDGDNEFIGQCLKHIKRQLKRAWPTVLDESALAGQEKIYVQAHAFGQHSLKAKEALRLPEIANLYLTSHSLAHFPGPLGSLEVARDARTQLLGDANQLPELGASC